MQALPQAPPAARWQATRRDFGFYFVLQHDLGGRLARIAGDRQHGRGFADPSAPGLYSRALSIPADSAVAPFTPPGPEELFALCFGRVYHFGRRWDEALWRFHELGAILRLLEERPELRQGPILDLGCGDGEVFGWLFGPRADADGIDSGATRLGDLALAQRTACYRDVRCEDAAQMSFPDASYRLVFSNSVLEHIAPIAPILRQVARVLEPGGHFLFTTPDPILYSPEAYAWRRVLQPFGLDGLGQALVRKECDVYCHVSVLSGEEWRGQLAAAGLDQVARTPYFPADAARATSLFSGASRIPALRSLIERLSPLARELSSSDDDQAAWVARCRRVLDRFVRPKPDLPGCGQLLLAQRPPPQTLDVPSMDTAGPRRPRVLWVCQHRVARFEEVGALLRAGAEVIPVAGEQEEFPNAVRLREEDDPLYPRWRPSCSIPEAELDLLRQYDYFGQPDQPDPHIVRLLDRYIDVIWVGSYTPVVVGLLRHFSGSVVLRTYGGYPYTEALGSWAAREPALALLGASDRYAFCPALPYQALIEDPRLSRGDTYWPACVTADRLAHRWAGPTSEPVACETISLIDRYRRQVYQQYLANFGGLPLRILGQNEAGGPDHDARVVGTLPDDAYYGAIAQSRLMLYAGLGTKYHLHYHALEAMAMGVPVVFFDTSALAHVSLYAGHTRADLRAMGGCCSVAEAHALARRLLDSRQAASELAERQRPIRAIFEPEPWDDGVARMVNRMVERQRYRRQHAGPAEQLASPPTQRWAQVAVEAAWTGAAAMGRLTRPK